MVLAGELAEAEWRARRNRYIALGALLAATAAASFLVLSVVNGLEEGIGGEISQTLGGDVRIARNKTGLGDGAFIEDYQDVETRLRGLDRRAVFAPRLETQAIFLKDADFTAGSSVGPGSRAAAVVVGIDPDVDARVLEMDHLIVEGESREALSREWRGPSGERLVPLIVGRSFLETGNGTVYNGTFSWTNVYNFSAGTIENNQMIRAKGIVVGVYETGFRMIDRLVVYAPRGEVARLLGEFPTDPPANVILAKTSTPDALADAAREDGYEVAVAKDFREVYLAPVFVNVRVAAWAIVALLALMTAGWMGYTIAHHVHEDRRKIATLRAVGIPANVIGRTYLLLAGALSAVGASLGIVVAVALAVIATIATRWTGLLAPRPSLGEALLLVGLSLAAALGAVKWAVRRASRISIRDALQAP